MPRETVNKARQLRRDLTPAEKIFWAHLRGRRFAGFKFRRQHPIAPFVADFFCLACKLILEIDGETHLGKEKTDQKRQEFLEAQGYMVLRFWNTQVFDETEAVMEKIFQVCESRFCPSLVEEHARSGGVDSLTPGPSPGGRGEP